MNKRQGFLDGEDQKTLISFILYGDPLAFPIDLPRLSKSVIRSTYSPNELKTVCSRIPEHEPLPTVAPEVMAHVKSIVAKYLPGMSDARINISQEHTYCQGSCKNCPTGILCPTAAISAKSIPNFRSDRKVIIMDKTFHKNDLTHRQYARLTIDPRGKVIKFAVSR